MILGTRLALIQYNKTVATGLLLMGLMRLVLLYLNWYFWLERWKNVMRHFIDELALNLISSSNAFNRTLATILTILIHDCIHKDGLNHIALKKYKAEIHVLAEVSDQYRAMHNLDKVFKIILLFKIQAPWITNDSHSNFDSTYRCIVYYIRNDRYLSTGPNKKK